MPTKSDNTKGNPYHDNDGKFTTANGTGSPKKEDNEIKISSNQLVVKPTVKIKSGKIEEVKNRVLDINQCANVPKLYSALDIENHIEQFFSKQVCGKILELYGNSSNCQSYQFRPKSNPNKVLEIFPNVLAKYRFKDNHANYISNEQYQKLSETSGFIKNYRGMTSNGDKAKRIKDSYCDANINRFDLLCPNEGNCWGSNIYTSYSLQTARSYAGYSGTVIYGVLDERKAHVLQPWHLSCVKDSINYSSVSTKVEKLLLSRGVDAAKSARIAKSFSTALSKDIGLVAILLGVDYFEANDRQSQKNILNASRWYINKDM